jgi:hypothetical protein
MGVQKAQALLELLREAVQHASDDDTLTIVEAVVGHVMADLDKRTG